jgi:hypothetical protein
MKRNIIYIVVLVLFIVSLAACGAVTKTQTSTPQASTPAYPLPSSGTQQAIDAYPGYPTVMVETGGSYPVPGEDTVPTLVRYKVGEVPPTPSDAPQPEKGKASISGTLFSFTSLQVLPQVLFYLTPAQGENHDTPPVLVTGPQPEKGDISANSDANGQFQLNNIPPGNYFMFVWSAYNWPMAEVSPTETNPRLITLTADQKAVLGVVYFSWP